MTQRRKMRITLKDLKFLHRTSRRQFLKTAAGGMGGVLIADRCLGRSLGGRPAQAQAQP